VDGYETGEHRGKKKRTANDQYTLQKKPPAAYTRLALFIKYDRNEGKINRKTSSCKQFAFRCREKK